MDPFLEQPRLWPAFHNRLIVAIADTLAPSLRPNYYVEIETRTYADDGDGEVLIGIPDAAVMAKPDSAANEVVAATLTIPKPKRVSVPMPERVKERYLEVRDLATDEVITVVEVLSPKNKRMGEGRTAYLKKRQAILGSSTHLVEIDLLRAGRGMPLGGNAMLKTYGTLVSRSNQRPSAEVYDFDLQEPISSFNLPLRGEHGGVGVDLQAIVSGVYGRAGYDLRLDYTQIPPPPKLTPGDAD